MSVAVDTGKRILQRNSVKGRITRICNFSQSEDAKDIPAAKVRLAALHKLFEKYDDLQTSIEMDEDEEADKHEQERQSVEEKVYTACADLQRIIDSQHHSIEENVIPPPRINVKLPQLDLPTFDGKIKDWPSFKNIFMSSIGDSALPNIQKLQYLKSVLRGEAAGLVGSLLITEDNYEKAVNILTNRYENKIIIVNHHLKAIVNCSIITRHNIKEFLITLQQSLDSLDALALNTSHWDILLVFLITQKMDSSLRASWEISRKETNLPTLAELIEFLNLRMTAFELINDRTPEARAQVFTKTKVSHNVTVDVGATCIMCNAQHVLNKCPEFEHLPPPQRIDYVRSNTLCFNCLKPYRHDHKCSKHRCMTCHGRHHTMLHIESPPIQANAFHSSYSANEMSTLLPMSDLSAPLYNSQVSAQAWPTPTQPLHTVSAQVLPTPTQPLHTVSAQALPTHTHPPLTGSAQALPTRTQPSYTVTAHSLPTATQPLNTPAGPVSPYCPSDNANYAHRVSTDPAVHTARSMYNKHVLLSTALIRVQDASGQWHAARALLDSGSEINLVTNRLALKLNCPFQPNACAIQGIGTMKQQTNVCITTNIASRISDFKAGLTCFVMDRITVPLPHSFVDPEGLNIPKQQARSLADPNFNMPGDIDLLIGAQLFYTIVGQGHISLGHNLPHLINSVFGWIVSGSLISDSQAVTCMAQVSLHLNNHSDQLIARFWEQEELPTKPVLTPDQRYCEQLFKDTTTQDENGRYIVQLPINKESINKIGNSFNTAFKCLLQLESKFDKDPNLAQQYKQFIHEFIDLGHAEIIEGDFKSNNSFPTFFLPHHAIIKPDSISTKLRTVFNASAQSSTGVSLNDALYEGPNIYNNVLDIILRFRMHKWVFTTDIVKMFRNILVTPEQRPLLRLLWRDDKTSPLVCIQLSTVTYGTKCAPFLACRTLRDLADRYGHTHPHAAQCIQEQCFMDDLMSGGDSIQSVKQLCDELIDLLHRGCFLLHKWSSNSNDILRHVTSHADTDINIASYDFSPECIVKTLGLKWVPTTDCFTIAMPDSVAKKITKRTVLSKIAQIFDPLGLLSPTIISAKLLMQDIWRQNLDWDCILPTELETQWAHFINNLQCLRGMELPRYYFADIPIQLYLLGYCDSSSRAYGACIYLRAIYPNRIPTCTLVMAKTKVAPIRPVSIPRLELCSALLLARIVGKLDGIFSKFKIEKTYLFSDSTIVLHWLKSPYKRYNVYVSNRLMEILENTSVENWYYINTKENPADLLTRGISPEDLVRSSLWWQGPNWVCKAFKEWPISKPHNLEEPDCRLEIIQPTMQTIHVATVGISLLEYFNTVSSFTRLNRIIAYVFRFRDNLKSKTKTGNPLSVTELNNAHDFIIRTVQQHYFPREFKELSSTNPNKNSNEFYTFKSSPMRKLDPFLSDKLIIRVGGRISHANTSFDHAHPIILPSKSHVTTLIIEQYHKRLFHEGIQTTLSAVRFKYWPIRGRTEVRKVVHQCVRCIRFRATTCKQQMAALPDPRVSLVRAFAQVGIDFSGAISIRNHMQRNCKYTKGYICLFICLATRAIHIELVGDLTTQAFINALKRFIGRRGICSHIYSDNATNFKGAHNELNELYRNFQKETSYSEIVNFCSNSHIQWHFTVPLASHMGGIYESGIKSLKLLLKRQLGNSKLNYELLNTVLIQIEGILNSRPLCPLYDEPNDLACLTPAHFIIGAPIVDLPEPDVTNVSENRLSLYKRVTRFKQMFWRQFYKQYLSELQARTKWLCKTENLEVNTIVLIKDENTPPSCWPLGRVIEVYRNKSDNLVRSALIRTANGEYHRPIHKLVRVLEQ